MSIRTSREWQADPDWVSWYPDKPRHNSTILCVQQPLKSEHNGTRGASNLYCSSRLTINSNKHEPWHTEAGPFPQGLHSHPSGEPIYVQGVARTISFEPGVAIRLININSDAHSPIKRQASTRVMKPETPWSSEPTIKHQANPMVHRTDTKHRASSYQTHIPALGRVESSGSGFGQAWSPMGSRTNQAWGYQTRSPITIGT